MAVAPLAAVAAVGTTAGSFDVGSGGDSNYNVPITAPPGTGGMQPSLALVYNSQGSNGAAGVGWELGGLSQISRCPRTQASDAARGGVNLDANDRFCLDGKRLMVTAGAYGANGAEYRTEIETFSKVISYGTAGTGPSYFKVWTKSGQIVEYGNTSDSKILAAGKPTALTWAQNKVSDAKGNYLTVSYVNNNGIGEYYPTRVDYTGNAAAALAPYASVQFNYATRTDLETAMVAGSIVQSTKRLTSIKTYYGATVVKSYNLTYQTGTATKRSRLVSVQECDGSATPTCLPATQFGWQEGGTATFSPESYTAGVAGFDLLSASDQVLQLDYNGDGKQDVLLYRPGTGRVALGRSNGNGTFTQALFSTTGIGGFDLLNVKDQILAVDYSGDGKTDLVMYRPGDRVIYAARSNGNGSFTNQLASHAGLGGYDLASSTDRVVPLDYNGDGRMDLVLYRPGQGAISVARSNGNGTFTQEYFGSAGVGGFDLKNSADQILPMDFDGDSRSDLVIYRPGHRVFFALSSDGDGTFTSKLASFAGVAGFDLASASDRVISLDYNGDGKMDVVLYRPGVGAISVGRSNGNGSFTSEYFSMTGIAGFNLAAAADRIVALDYNGDGKSDLMLYRPGVGSTWIARSNGTGGFVAEYASQSGVGGYDMKHVADQVIPMDYRGDGKTDLVLYRPGVGSFFAVRSSGVFPDLLTSISNGLGAITSIGYKSLTDATVYAKDSTAVYPVMDVQAPIYVVASAGSTNGVGGTATTNYDYAGLKVDLNGRGLGFRWMEAHDVTTGMLSHTDYSQTYPYIGMHTYAKSTRVSTGVIQSTTTQTLAAQALGGSRYLPYAATTVDRKYELAGELVTTRTTTQALDTYGNATSVTITTVGGGGTWTTLTTNTYSNNATTWKLGLLTQSSVKNTIPGGANATRLSSFVYDANGLLTSENVEPNQATLKVTNAYTYDAFGNRSSFTTSGSGITSRTNSVGWSSNGRFPISATNALGHVETSTYENLYGNPLGVTDSNALVTTWSYDSFGRKIGEVRPDGTTSTVSYANCGTCPTHGSYLVTVSSTGAPTEKTYYDKLQRAIRSEVQGFDGVAVYQDTQYNSLGQAWRTSRPYYVGGTVYWATTVFDAIGRVVSVTDADGGVTSSSYNGLSTTVTNQLGQTKTTVLDAVGRTKTVTEAAGSMSYSYDPFGNLLSSTDPLGNQILMSYDIRGFKTAQTDPDLGIWTFASNVLGQVTSQTDAKAQTTTFTYDVLGRMTQRVQPGQTDTWTFDTRTKGKGKPATAATNTGYSRTHNYDSLGRPSSTSYTIDSTYVISTTYDSAGRVATLTYPTGFAVKHVYNARGYLSEVRNNASNALYWQANTRLADGQITRSTLGNGLNTNYTYQANNGALTRIISGTANGVGVQDQSFGYDLADNLTSRSDARMGVVEGFSYDNMNRLTQSRVTAPVVVTKNYTYNAIGNLISKSDVGTYTYHATKKHAVASIAGTISTSFTYDANGNMLTGNGRTLTWKSWNMIASDSPGSNYWYDAEHNRSKRTEAGGSTTIFLNPRWDVGINFEKQTLPGGKVENKHSIYADGGAPIAMYTSSSTGTSETRYFHKDHLDSIAVITNESGTVVERRSYDAHGRLRATNGSDATSAIGLGTTNHGYTGHEMLTHSAALNSSGVGLINMNGRMYDPQIGRFMSADPFIQAPDSTQSYNRYTYVNNNPLSLTDPSGYFSFKKFFKKVTKPITNLISKAFKKPIVRVAVVVVAAAISGGAAAWAYSSYAAAAGSSAVTIGGSVAVTSGVISGAAGGFVAGGLMGGNLKSAALGAVTGAIGGGVGGYFGNSYSLSRVAAESVAGGVNSKIQGGSFTTGMTRAGAFSMLTYGNWVMRQDQIALSRRNPANANGRSAGFFGDFFKLAGARREYGINGLALACDAPLGGCQGAVGLASGDVAARTGMINYEPGSIFDTINESFAGPHDYFRDMTGSYTAMGNSVSITSTAGRYYDYVKNFGMLIPAAPFAVAGLVQTQAPAVIYLSGNK